MSTRAPLAAGGTGPRGAALAALALGAAATATNPVFVRLSELDPTGSAFHRMAWALPIMVAWAFLEPRPAARSIATRRRDIVLLALCGLFFALDLIALHWSIRLTTAANAILFLNAQPLYVAIGAWLLFGERIRAPFLVGLVVAFAGVGVMLGESAGFGRSNLVGDALGIAAGLCYAGYILAASGLRHRLSSAVVIAWTCAVASPLLLATALLAGRTVVPPSGRDWGLMIALGVISQAAGQGLIVWGLKHVQTALSSLTLLSAPVAAAVFAWAFLGETITAVQAAGMVVVLAGIYVAQRARG